MLPHEWQTRTMGAPVEIPPASIDGSASDMKHAACKHSGKSQVWQSDRLTSSHGQLQGFGILVYTRHRNGPAPMGPWLAIVFNLA